MNAFFAGLYAAAVACLLVWLIESKRRAGNIVARAARAEVTMAQAVLSVMAERLSNPIRLIAVRNIKPDQTTVLDGFAAHVAAELRSPTAFLHVLDAEHQIACSYFGCSPGQTDVQIKHSYCAFVVGIESPIAINDTRHHPLTVTPVSETDMGGMEIGAYLGVPVRCDGQVVGALCVIDRRARVWTTFEIARMVQFATDAEDLICAAR